MDWGTENTLIEDIQTAFHEVYGNHQQQSPCVIHSVSPHNQRMERFWRTLFDMMTNFWMDRLGGLVHDGVLDCSSPFHVECLRFCFMPLIQAELDEVRMEWNQHRPRTITNTDALQGQADLMYFVPEIFGARDFRIPVPMCEITTTKEEFTTAPRSSGCSVEFEGSCQDILLVHNKRIPSSFEEGAELFRLLLNALQP